MYILKLIYQKIENCIIIIDNNNIYIFIRQIIYPENNPATRELTFFVSKSCDPDFKQAVKRHRVGTLVGC